MFYSLESGGLLSFYERMYFLKEKKFKVFLGGSTGYFYTTSTSICFKFLLSTYFCRGVLLTFMMFLETPYLLPGVAGTENPLAWIYSSVSTKGSVIF
jgi:hypothetical protein